MDLNTTKLSFDLATNNGILLVRIAKQDAEVRCEHSGTYMISAWTVEPSAATTVDEVEVPQCELGPTPTFERSNVEMFERWWKIERSADASQACHRL